LIISITQYPKNQIQYPVKDLNYPNEPEVRRPKDRHQWFGTIGLNFPMDQLGPIL